MAYDDVGNVETTTLTGSGNLAMSTSALYTNSDNLLSSITEATGATVTYGYGQTNHDDTILTSAAYSCMMGLPTTVTTPNDTTTSTACDLYGRVTQTSVASPATLKYTYDKGNLKTITRTANGKSQAYSLAYDSFGKVTAISVGSKELATYHYT